MDQVSMSRFQNSVLYMKAVSVICLSEPSVWNRLLVLHWAASCCRWSDGDGASELLAVGGQSRSLSKTSETQSLITFATTCGIGSYTHDYDSFQSVPDAPPRDKTRATKLARVEVHMC